MTRLQEKIRDTFVLERSGISAVGVFMEFVDKNGGIVEFAGQVDHVDALEPFEIELEFVVAEQVLSVSCKVFEIREHRQCCCLTGAFSSHRVLRLHFLLLIWHSPPLFIQMSELTEELF